MKDEGSNTEPTTSENPVKRWLVRNKVYISWGVLALLVGYVGVASILAFAGQKLPMVTFFTVEVLDNQAKGAIVTAAVSWVAGIAALFTFFLNRDQKEKHLQKQLEQDAMQAERQRQQDKEHHLAQLGQARTFEDERAKKEAKQAELQRLEKLFGDLAEDFASDVVLNRINAAIGLSEIAQTPDPRSETLEKTKENYPYFLRAADRLAAALHQWGEQPARDEVRKALTQLAAFAKDEGTSESLLHALCNALAHANRTALGIFVETMAEGLSAGRPNLTELAELCQFLDDPTETESCLKLLSESPEGEAAFRRWKRLRLATDDVAPAGLAADFYPRFTRASQALLDARDALAGALNQLSKPVGFPDFHTYPYVPINMHSDLPPLDRYRLKLFATRRSLKFAGTFLPGADLSEAELQGAMLQSAYLSAANMNCAQLEGANLSNAHLEGLKGYLANLQFAIIARSKLRKADLSSALLRGANLKETQLPGADLRMADLKAAQLFGAQLHGADLSGAWLVDAGLAGAECGQNGGHPAVFSPGGWVDADFSTAKVIENGVPRASGEEDTVLKNWLMATYPPDTPPGPRKPLF